MKEDSKFKCHICANQQTDIVEDGPCTELNYKSPETVEMFCYLGDIIGFGGGAVGSGITRI